MGSCLEEMRHSSASPRTAPVQSNDILGSFALPPLPPRLAVRFLFQRRGKQQRLRTGDEPARSPNQRTTAIRNEMLRDGRRRWGARGNGQQRRSERREGGSVRDGTRELDGPDRSTHEGQLCDRGGTEPAGGAVILIVHRTGMMMVVRVGAGLIRRMGKDPPVGPGRGTRLVGPCVALAAQVELVECGRDDPREVEQQEQRRPVLDAGRPAGLKSGLKAQTTHATHATHTRAPFPTQRPGRQNRDSPGRPRKT